MIDKIRRFVEWRIVGIPDTRLPKTDKVDIKEAEKVLIDWPEETAKPSVGLTRDTNENPHWTKFRRFLKNNRFDF